MESPVSSPITKDPVATRDAETRATQSKRPLSALDLNAVNKSFKRSKLLQTPQNRVSYQQLPTPHASSDADSTTTPFEDVFKVPDMPTRLNAPLTPSSSSIARSSSPRQTMSSPSRTDDQTASDNIELVDAGIGRKVPGTSAIQNVTIEYGTTLIFGRRHRHNKPRVTRASKLSIVAQATGESLSETLAHPGNAVRNIFLDRRAIHASRDHAVVELVNPNTIKVIAVGQNGVRVKQETMTIGNRLFRGATKDFHMAKRQDSLELDFYGAKVLLQIAQPTRRVSPLSLPPSSPPMFADDIDEDEDNDAEEEPVGSKMQDSDADDEDLVFSSPVVVRNSSPPYEDSPSSPLVDAISLSASDRESSPLTESDSSPQYGTSALPEPLPAPFSAVSVKQELVSLSNATPSSSSITKSRASSPVLEIPPIPDNLDLAALLVSSVVFSGSSKLSLPDLIKSLLETQPSLREHGSEAILSAWAGEELERNPMFGKVERHGKDSSGRPLLPHYFYDPTQDPDVSRAKQLGGLVRPLRAAQRGGGKSIDWRPVGSGRRRY